jgi:dipeptidase E
MRTVKVSEDERHIVAMGGAFGYDTPASALFLRYILRLTRKRKPHVLFVGTASGDNDYGPLWFHRQLGGLSCERRELRFFEPVTSDLNSLLLSQDAIFVGGGNTKAMLAVWREYGFDKAVVNAWEHGVVLAGASAGGMCWFRQAISASSFADNVVVLPGLEIAGGSCCPHYDSDPQRRPAFHRLLHRGPALAGYGIDEKAALHITGRSSVQSLAGEPGAACYLVHMEDGKPTETKLPTRLLKTRK